MKVILRHNEENERGGMGWVEIDGVEYPCPPDGVRVWANGTGQDIETTRITAGAGTFAPDTARNGAPTLITPETSPVLRAKRFELMQDSIDAALIARYGSSETGRAVLAHVLLDIVESGDRSESRKAIKDLSSMAGFTRQAGRGGQVTNNAVVLLDTGRAADILRLLDGDES